MKDDNSSNKATWRRSWLNAIGELTSLETQKRLWLNPTKTNIHDSFVEFMCFYFDDLSIEDNYKWPLENSHITVDEYNTIKDWHELLSSYKSPNDNDTDDAAIIADQKWLDIVEQGAQAKTYLASKLADQELKDLLGTDSKNGC